MPLEPETTTPAIAEEPVLEDGVPYLRIHATYPASFDSGHPETITIDLDPASEDETDTGEDLTRFVVETITSLRSTGKPHDDQVAIDLVFNAPDLSPEKLQQIQDRLDALQRTRRTGTKRHGARGLPRSVVDKVLGRDKPAYATGGPISGPGAADTDHVPAALGGGCWPADGRQLAGTAALPYDNDIRIAPVETPKDGE